MKHPKKCSSHIIQLDRIEVKVIGKLKDGLVHVSPNSNVHWIIDIIIVKIIQAYGLLLSRYWSPKLQGYFTSSWCHIWLPLNEKPNKVIND